MSVDALRAGVEFTGGSLGLVPRPARRAHRREHGVLRGPCRRPPLGDGIRGQRAGGDGRRDRRHAGPGRRRHAPGGPRPVDVAARRPRRPRGQAGAAEPGLARGDRGPRARCSAATGRGRWSTSAGRSAGATTSRTARSCGTWSSRLAASPCTPTCSCGSPTPPTCGATASTCWRGSRGRVCGSCRWRRPTRRACTSPSATRSCSTRCRTGGRRSSLPMRRADRRPQRSPAGGRCCGPRSTCPSVSSCSTGPG